MQQLAADILFGDGFPLHEFLEFLQVFLRIKGDAEAFPAVASGPSGLLIVAFKALWNVIMNDEAHVGLVNTHSEGYRCNDDIDTLHEKVVLGLRARGTVKSRMIGGSFYFVGFQHLRKFFHFLA